MTSDVIIKPCPPHMMKLSPEWHWDVVARMFVKQTILDRLKVRQEAEQTENLREAVATGRPVFSFSNHLSWSDHFLIMIAIDDCIRVPVATLTKERYYQYPVFGWVLRRTNQIPLTNIKLCFARWFKQANGYLPRQSDFIQFMTDSAADPSHEANVFKRQSLARSVAYTNQMLERKRIILGYPEGTRSRQSGMQPIKTGIMQLPFECKGIILPTAISGTDKILPKGIKWHKVVSHIRSHQTVTNVRFGRPLDYTELLDRCEKKFERIDDIVNLENVWALREQIENSAFRAFTAESERFERIFDESSLIVMREVNENLPEEYKTEQVEIKYPR